MVAGSFTEMIGLSAIMGFSIYLSFPIILKRDMNTKSTVLLVSLAIGILIFLLGDIFSDAASRLYQTGSYQANPVQSIIFVSSVGGLFALLYLIGRQKSGAKTGESIIPTRVALIVAIGMGLQNLTEGLVFGSAYVVGLTGLFLVILLGFILQNFTEGFPIISPFLGGQRPRLASIAGLYFIGGFPSVAGGLIGYFYVNAYLEILFDGLAMGAILYVIIPLTRTVLGHAQKAKAYSLIYLGLLIGFIAGFAVNAL